ncbi:MAG: deoxyribose-phosphate aldolase [Planctomycetota bacterium]|jgi:deoxyribose-phosphate aldolase
MKLEHYIDHTLLRPEATRKDIERLCAEAKEFGFYAVCVYGSWISDCIRLLRDSETKLVGVAGFPSGASTPNAKAGETGELVDLGADEIDVVAPIGQILMGDWSYVRDDIAAVVQAAGGRTVKVILETAALTPDQIVEASSVAVASGAQFVKTSTGLHPAGGASIEAVTLMRRAVGAQVGVKAAGGIRDRETALRMIAAGASRIGTSAAESFMNSVNE